MKINGLKENYKTSFDIMSEMLGLDKINVDKIRVYFTGENLYYWSPLKKNCLYVDPESAFSRSSDVDNHMSYTWQKTMMFGIDITF